jgi:two-component system, OmpR family, sensor histidine kinase MprB
MSLRRRIALAAALAVAAVAIAMGVVGYTSARSHLIGEIKQELRSRASTYLSGHRAGRLSRVPLAEDGHTRPGASVGSGALPPGPALGGAPGYFQLVYPTGKASAPEGGKPQLSVSARVLAVARGKSGSFFTTARVKGVHAEVLTVADTHGGEAVQIALPLTEVDSVLHGLLLPYGLLVGGGVLLGLLLAAALSRSALAPIERFLQTTESMDVDQEHPGRLEESGASELRRLAASFNRTLDALERSIEAQRSLVADASHELRTPIAALRSNIQIFLESHRLPLAERIELQRSIITELDELTEVIADVMELARGATPTDQREPVELDVLVSEAVERAQRRTPGLRFELDLQPTVIDAAVEQVARAVGNVIENACKWSPPDGTIVVQLSDGTVSVRDHGPGFHKQDLEHAFDRFYRAEDARRLPGSGLGLAIVKQTADAHHGKAVATNAPGGGALVQVSFGTPTHRFPFDPS